MSEEVIPPKNLPIYLQKYTVAIHDGKKEPTTTGEVLYSTVGAIPSNVAEARVWELNLSGVLRPKSEKYTVVYDFKNVDYENKNITFENIVSGTFIICGQVLDASKVIGRKYDVSDAESTLTLLLNFSNLGFQLKKETPFSYNVSINDDSVAKQCKKINISPPTAIYKGAAVKVIGNRDCIKTTISGENGEIPDSTILWKVDVLTDTSGAEVSLLADGGSASFNVYKRTSTQQTISDLYDSNDYGINTETFNISYNTNSLDQPETSFSFIDYTISGESSDD